MRRFRWFKLTSKSELEKIERQICARKFSLSEPVSSGFRVESKDFSGLTGQFVYKRTVDQKIMLPSGEEFSQEVANIDVTKFGIDYSSGGGLLYLIDPPRSATPFFSALSEATQFGCTLNPIEVNVEKWIEHLQSHNERISVIYLDVADIALSQVVRARVAVAGEKNVATVFREAMPLSQHGRVESAKIRYPFGDGTSLVVELGCRASLKLPAAFPSEEIQLLRESMLLSVKE
ncbi:hypothetical protein [Aeromonas hydrophila]|uniref:hypothetical protein n=1 Tax=Aeromonas hydrophila TaxID=644 RepID=UPI00126A3EEC|nr:hypothetical protein [Aeromonas hydrophila]